MEAFFEVVKGSELYKDYFDYLKNLSKISEVYSKFAKEHGLESTEFYPERFFLRVRLTENDKKKFGKMLLKNSRDSFRKNSYINKEWVKMCADLDLKSADKPWLIRYIPNLYSVSQRLFNINDKLYGSVDNHCDSDISLDKDTFIKLKGSYFYKIMGD